MDTTAADVMSPAPLFAAPREGPAACAERMRRHHVRHLLVPLARGQVGVLSEADALRMGDQPPEAIVDAAAPAPLVPPELPLRALLLRLLNADGDLVVIAEETGRALGVFTEHDAMRLAAETLLDDVPVARIATTEIVCASHGWTISRAIGTMQRHRIRHLPVLARGRLAGIVSARDLRQCAARSPRAIAEFVSPPTETVVGDTTVREAAERMATQKVGCLPIVGPDNQLQALLTSTDVLGALLAEVFR